MKFIHFYNPFLWPLTLAFLFCLYNVIVITMIHYPYERRGKNCRREQYKASFIGIGYRDCYWQRGTKFDFLSIFSYTIIDEEDKMSSASLIFKKGKNPLSIVYFLKTSKTNYGGKVWKTKTKHLTN